MRFCSNCGKEVNENADVCLGCGKALNSNIAEKDTGIGGGMKFLCFMLPLLGLILYCVWRKDRPKSAKSAGKSAAWGFGISVGFTILMMCVTASVTSSILSGY